MEAIGYQVAFRLIGGIRKGPFHQLKTGVIAVIGIYQAVPCARLYSDHKVIGECERRTECFEREQLFESALTNIVLIEVIVIPWVQHLISRLTAIAAHEVGRSAIGSQ